MVDLMSRLFGLIAKKRIHVLFQVIELIHTFGKQEVKPTRCSGQKSTEKYSSHLTPTQARMKGQSH